MTKKRPSCIVPGCSSFAEDIELVFGLGELDDGPRYVCSHHHTTCQACNEPMLTAHSREGEIESGGDVWSGYAPERTGFVLATGGFTGTPVCSEDCYSELLVEEQGRVWEDGGHLECLEVDVVAKIPYLAAVDLKGWGLAHAFRRIEDDTVRDRIKARLDAIAEVLLADGTLFFGSLEDPCFSAWPGHRLPWTHPEECEALWLALLETQAALVHQRVSLGSTSSST